MDYNLKANSVSALIKKYGTQAVFESETAPAIDPITGEETGTGSTTSFAANVIKTNYNDFEIEGTEIQKSDTKLLLEAVSGTPEQGMKVTVSGDTYRVINFKSVEPADIPIVYKVQVRK